MAKRTFFIKSVVKLDNRKEKFDSLKILESIWIAAKNVGGKDKKLSEKLKDRVLDYLSEKYPKEKELKTSLIGEAVEKILIENGHAKTAKEYILYRENKKDQVIEFGMSQVKKEYKCPNCNIKLIKDNKCLKCKKCGFSTCEL